MNNMEYSERLYTLTFGDIRTYLVTLVFMIGNMVLPYLCHTIPQGGIMLLPIYFFTLVGAYKYGMKAGLLIALLSPLFNYSIFGMPSYHMLGIIITKGVLLAVAASFVAQRVHKVTLWALAIVVLAYQIVGTAVEWGMTQSLSLAVQDVAIGYPGLLIQCIGGYFVLKALNKI